MRRTVIIAIGALLLLSATTWAQPRGPFGSFDGSGNNDSLTGVAPLTGWALSSWAIAHVDIYVDGIIVGRAEYGRERPIVTQLAPGYPDSFFPGFAFQLNTTRFLNGLHVVSVLATDAAGNQAWVGSKEFEFMNASHLLKPFGEISFPNETAELRGACNLADPFRRYSVVEGWALDVGVEQGSNSSPPGDSGVSTVEFLIDGSLIYNTDTDCSFSSSTGGYTQCYGLRTLNLDRIYPNLPDAAQAGFRFVLDVGALIELGWVQGSHVFSVRAHDFAGNVATIDEQVVFFRCDENLGNEASFGITHWAKAGRIQWGTAEFLGWALDWEGISRVDIYVDGVFDGTATYGLPRPKIAGRYPGYPDSAGPGYSYLLDTTLLHDGEHDIQAIAYDIFGNSTLIGERRFVVNNDAP